MLSSILIVLICSLCFRIRGGLRIPFTDKKFPLNKFWFALGFAGCWCWLNGWNLNSFAVIAIATYVSTSAFGWGEFAGSVLGIGKPSERSDCPMVDDIVDNLVICGHKLVDYPIAFGWVGLSMRGLILSFIIGLALNSIPFMLYGLAMGSVYYVCGLFARKVLKKMDKTGWNISEWVFGAYLGLCLLGV